MTLFLAVLACSISSVVAEPPDGYSLFDAARWQWQQQRYPRMLSYTIAVEGVEAHATDIEHYSAFYDQQRDQIFVDPISDFELKHPMQGRGMNPFNFFGIQIGKPELPVDFLGVPKLAPNYSFGMSNHVGAFTQTPSDMIEEIRREFGSAPRKAPITTADGSLHEIGSVEARETHYRIEMVGRETIDGVGACHLHLSPIADAWKYRLRDLWIDESSHQTLRIRTERNFVYGPGSSGTWVIDFQNVAGRTFIGSETTDDPIEFEGRKFQKAIIRFEGIQDISDQAKKPRFRLGLPQYAGSRKVPTLVEPS